MPARLIRRLPTLIGIAASLAVFLLDSVAIEQTSSAERDTLVDRWPAHWVYSAEEASRIAQESNAVVLVYAYVDSFACRTLERAAGCDAILSDELKAHVLLAVDLESSPDTHWLAQEFGISAGPLMVAIKAHDFEMKVHEPESIQGRVGIPIRPITGGLYEPIGLATELGRISALESTSPWRRAARDDASVRVRLEAIDHAEAAGLGNHARRLLDESLALERQPNGPFHRLQALREATRTHSTSGAADSEGTIEAALLVEDNAWVLYHGWSMLASVFDLRAVAADERGTYRDADASRWRRRMRDASRLAWISCPDSALVPFGSLLIERYGASLDALDSLDRMFCRAVLRTLQRTAPESPRVARAAEVVASMK